MFEKIIYHIDVNSAFLSWEATYRLYHKGGKVDLREQVAAVGGDVTMRHGIILAKSIPAKKYNIKNRRIADGSQTEMSGFNYCASKL